MYRRTAALLCVSLFAAIFTACGHKPVTLEEIGIDGMKLTVRGTTLEVAPLEVKADTHNAVLKTGTPGWRGPVYTPKTSWRYRAMTTGSLHAICNGTELEEGTDYLVDYDWGTVAAPEGSRYAGKEVTFTYRYTLSRLDLVVRTAEGEIVLVPGTPDARKPLLPEAPEGATPLFSVYLPHNTTELAATNINVMDPDAKPYGPAYRTGRLAALVKKMKAGPFRIVFIGDSITAQTDPEGGSYVLRFVNWLKESFADRKITYIRLEKQDYDGTMAPVVPENDGIAVVMAGIGGNNSGQGRERFDRHVLVHKPDLVFIMFGVNDENRRDDTTEVSHDTYEQNLTAMVKKCRDSGSEPVLMTTSMKNLEWVATSGTLDEYARRARKVAEENDVCLIDHYAAWEELPTRGYNYMIPLGSCINHPVDMGHELFFRDIRAVFDGLM